MKIYNEDQQLTDQVQSYIQSCRSALHEVVKDRSWITATPISVGSEAMALELVQLGAKKVLAIGVAEGIRHKALDDEEGAHKIQRHCLNLSFEGNMMDGIRGSESALNQLNDETLAIINRFDPLQQARVMRAIFSDHNELANRAVFGAREGRWKALEDKTIIDTFWDQAGVQRVKSVIIDLNLKALLAAFNQMNQGVGIVVAGDNRSGSHGGATHTRWARTHAQLKLIVEDLSQSCDCARVMPYLEGVSCSMHGWVFPSGEYISLKPCEMLVAESERETIFDYHGAATNWQPNLEIHEQMTQAVHLAATYLATHYQYLGVFTIDGIATAEGFFPTELNPRFGGAIGRMSAALPDLPLLTMHYATIEGHELGISPSDLRELVISAADAKPIIRGMMEIHLPCSTPQDFYYQNQGSDWIACDESDDYDAKAKWGKATIGSLIFAYLEPRCFLPGEATINVVREFMTLVKGQINES
jgi:hypothetical protein